MFLVSLLAHEHRQATTTLLLLTLALLATMSAGQVIHWAWRRHTAPRTHGIELTRAAGHDPQHPAVLAYHAERGIPAETWPDLHGPKPRPTPAWAWKLTAWTLRGWWWRATTTRSTPTEKAAGALLVVLGTLMIPVELLIYATMLANPNRRWIATSWHRNGRHLQTVVSLQRKHGRNVDINCLLSNAPDAKWAALPMRHHLPTLLAWADHQQITLTAKAAQTARVHDYQGLLPGMQETGKDGLGRTHLRRLPHHP